MAKKLLFPVLAIFFLSLARTTYAHPLDEIGNITLYDQTQKLEISPAKTELTIDLTFYAVEKIKVWESIDTNRDQFLDEKEKDNWMKKGQDASWIEMDNQKFVFEAYKLQFPGYYDFFSEKPAAVKIQFTSNFRGSTGKNKTINYFYKGKDKPLDQITFKAIGRDGLKVEDLTKRDSDSISFTILGGNQTESGDLGISASNRLNNFLNTFVKVDKIPIRLTLLALVSAFVIGFLHALTPGHGKAIVAGYLVGEKGSIWHAIQLGAIITLTHTSSVFLLGIAALLLTEYFVPMIVVKWMNTISGILVTGFGAILLVKRINHLLGHRDIKHDHEAEDPHHHDEKLSWKTLLPLGVSGGIVPCVDALAILIVAVSLGKTLFGIVLLVIFSLGLASALTFGGIAVVIAKSKAVKSLSSLSKYEDIISVLSALVVTTLGVAILLGIGL